MIHMGTSSIAHGAAALAVNGASAPRILHNTLIGGPTAGALSGALWLESSTTGAIVENNVLAGAGGAPQGSGLLMSCAGDAGSGFVSSFQNNLVFATTSGLMQWENCNGNAAYTTIDAMTAELQSTQIGATVGGNVTIAASCGTDSGCVANALCTSQGNCLAAVFDGFDTASYGYANLYASPFFVGACPATTSPTKGDGWPLAASPPCKVAHSTKNDSNVVPQDLYGNCRSQTAPSMGAAEYLGAICQ
jgi:hypothetical protein